MISLQSIAGGKRAVLLLLLFLVVALLLLPESRQDSLMVIGRPMATVIAVPLRGMEAANQTIDSLVNRYVALQHMREENLALRQHIARLQQENARLRETAQATTRLRDLLELQERLPYPTVAAQVIGLDSTNWYRSIVINKGRKNGLAADMGVVTTEGAGGRIVKDYDRFAIVEGTEKGLARIKSLPLLSTVKVGDQVVTSGLAGGFPRGLPIGTITKIERREAELFLSAEIALDADFAKIEEVLVITAPRESAQLPANPFTFQPAVPVTPAGETR